MLRKIYRKYYSKIFRNYNHIRGTWRIKHTFRNFLAKDLPQTEESPEPVFEKEWDNLLILDAARHDLYEELNGETESRNTLTSRSRKYIAENFSEDQYSDVVYVTGNPHFHNNHFEDITGRKVEEVFHEVFHTYKTDWDEEENTVLPEALIGDAKTAKKLFPDKRLVVHFMQPHYPFVKSDLTKGGIRPDLDHEKEDFSVWQRAEMGDYNQEELWKAYKQNLEYIMNEIEQFIEELEGTTAITSDHGNLVGENGLYGHSIDKPIKQLRKVPWDVRK